MMILSVGGSAEPVINAIKKGRLIIYFLFLWSERQRAVD